MLRITEIKLENFKIFGQSLCVKINTPFTCLVGENNTGKTTIFSAIDFLKTGVIKGKTIDDYKNKNQSDQHCSVEITLQGDLTDVVRELSGKKYEPYIFGDANQQTIRLKRSSEEREIQQNNKPIHTDHQKILMFNTNTQQFENVTGFDKAIGYLFETQFIWSDMRPDDIVDFGSTKILGKLFKDIFTEFQNSDEWHEFEQSHKKAFIEGEHSLARQADEIRSEIQASFTDFYGNGIVNFDFKPQDPSSFIKLGDVLIDDGSQTSMADKGSGMQRALALSIINVYARYLTNHKGSQTHLIKPCFFFIDEPEISLHPKAQSTLMDALLKIAEYQQVFITTHSPQLVKHVVSKKGLILITRKENDHTFPVIQPADTCKTFSFSPTYAEINFFAYGLCSTDFHNELYGYIEDILRVKSEKYKNFDHEICGSQNIQRTKKWFKECIKKEEVSPTPNFKDVTLMTYIRHNIHHPENTLNPKFTEKELQQSIGQMINIIQSEWFKLLSEQESEEQNHAD
ncbi:ATP-binding protein [Neisseriaceae bacterium ESL0693]|nr:ATP-binding protein [Neisseriaceae bacterium ESL0693]